MFFFGFVLTNPWTEFTADMLLYFRACFLIWPNAAFLLLLLESNQIRSFKTNCQAKYFGVHTEVHHIIFGHAELYCVLQSVILTCHNTAPPTPVHLPYSPITNDPIRLFCCVGGLISSSVCVWPCILTLAALLYFLFKCAVYTRVWGSAVIILNVTPHCGAVKTLEQVCVCACVCIGHS